MERIWHYNKPAKRGPPTKTHKLGKKGIIREAIKRPKITLKKLQSSTAEFGVSVHRTILSHTLHRA
jgi:transposase